jgi:hypothetical protein
MQPARPSTAGLSSSPSSGNVNNNGKDVQLKGQDNLAHDLDDVYEIRRKLESDEVREEFDLLASHGPKLNANERAFARTSLSKNRYVNVLPCEFLDMEKKQTRRYRDDVITDPSTVRFSFSLIGTLPLQQAGKNS